MIDTIQLEAILFVAGEDGISLETITSALNLSEEQVEKIIFELQSICDSSSRPYRIAKIKNKVSLVTKSEFSDIIGTVRKEIEKQPLTKSHLEILSVLLYNGPSAKVDIDAFRGVNSAQALRSLSLRGMIQKTGVTHGSSIYEISSEMLQSLGITSVEEALDYKKMNELLIASVQTE